MSDTSATSVARSGVINRGVYGTIVVTSVLVVCDGWAHLRALAAVAVIAGPVVAMVIGHIFAASLAEYAELRRRSTTRELLRIVRRESRFLLVCVPQIVVLLLMTLAGFGVNNTIRVLIWASAASLGIWGGIAARRAGLHGRGIALGVLMGLAAEASCCCYRYFLQPGKAVSNGVAAIQFVHGLVI